VLLLDIDVEIAPPRRVDFDMDMDIEPDADGFDLDPSFVSEYQAEIFAYKREMEVTSITADAPLQLISFFLSLRLSLSLSPSVSLFLKKNELPIAGR